MGKPGVRIKEAMDRAKTRADEYRAKIKAQDEYDSRRRASFEEVMFYIHERMREAVEDKDRDTARIAYQTACRVSASLTRLFPEWFDMSGADDKFIKPFEKLTGYVYGNKPR